MSRWRYVVFLLLFAFIAAGLGCSGGGKSPLEPVNPDPVKEVTGDSSHNIWGFFTLIADPVANTIEVVPQREIFVHLNVLPFLEPPVLVNLSIANVVFTSTKVEVDVGLTHPFIGLSEFTGFDVCGIVFTHGSISGFNNPELIMAGPGDTRMLNPDGYSRWWNPAEFTHGNTIFDYKDGLLGTPSSLADFNTTLNGYKYFAGGLTTVAPLSSVDLTKRGLFAAGQKNVRHYSIDLSGGLIFNYAVDANWEYPLGNPPYVAPDSFGPGANRPEPWRIETTEVSNTLYYDNTLGQGGGNLNLSIDVYDWFNADLNTIFAESKSGIPLTSTATPVGGGVGFSTYELDLDGAGLAVSGNIDLLITCQSDVTGYGNKLPGKPVCSYFFVSTQVENIGPTAHTLDLTVPDGGEIWLVGSQHNIVWTFTGAITDVKLEYSKDNFATAGIVISNSTPNTSPYDWLIPDDLSTTVKVRISEVGNPTINDTSLANFTIASPSGWDLVFPDAPVQISDSTYFNASNRGPAVIEAGNGDIVASWAQNRETNESPRPVDRISSNQGGSWGGLQTFPTFLATGDLGMLTDCKMGLDATGAAYSLSRWSDVDWESFWFNYIIRCPFDDDGDWGWQSSSSIRGVELAFTYDGYGLCFEDNDLFAANYEEIWVVRAPNPNDPMGSAYGSPNHSWFHQNFYTVAQTPAILSKGPSTARESSNKLWLAYQDGANLPTPYTYATHIQMVNNANGSGMSWNSSSPLTVATVSAPDISCQDPTLWIDSAGVMHLGYIINNGGAPATYSFQYMSSPTGDPAAFGTEENALSGYEDMSYPTLQVAEIPIGDAAVVSVTTATGLFATWRNPIDGTWDAAEQVDVNSIATEARMWVDQDNYYVHVVWAEVDGSGRYQVWYRRGQFIQQ